MLYTQAGATSSIIIHVCIVPGIWNEREQVNALLGEEPTEETAKKQTIVMSQLMIWKPIPG